MISTLLALTLAHHNDANPYGWHMSCERFLQKRIEILMDDNLDRRSKYNLIGYFRSKVEGECSNSWSRTQVSRGTERSSHANRITSIRNTNCRDAEALMLRITKNETMPPLVKIELVETVREATEIE